MLAKLGVVPQQIAAGDVYPALERGTIDAAEFVGPYDDEKLGLLQGGEILLRARAGGRAARCSTSLVNQEQMGRAAEELSGDHAMQACEAANNWMLAKYDAVNAQALRRMVGSGTELRLFPQAIMEASLKAANELYGELSEKSPDFKRAYEFDGRLPRRRAALVAGQRIPYDAFMVQDAGAELVLHLSPLAGRGRLGRGAERVRGCRRWSATVDSPSPSPFGLALRPPPQSPLPARGER